MSSGVTTASSNGSVTLLNTCQRPAPSTRAASTNSVGIDCKAPMHTSMKYGVVNHTDTRITEIRAHHGSNNHGGSNGSSLLMRP